MSNKIDEQSLIKFCEKQAQNSSPEIHYHNEDLSTGEVGNDSMKSLISQQIFDSLPQKINPLSETVLTNFKKGLLTKAGSMQKIHGRLTDHSYDMIKLMYYKETKLEKGDVFRLVRSSSAYIRMISLNKHPDIANYLKKLQIIIRPMVHGKTTMTRKYLNFYDADELCDKMGKKDAGFALMKRIRTALHKGTLTDWKYHDIIFCARILIGILIYRPALIYLHHPSQAQRVGLNKNISHINLPPLHHIKLSSRIAKDKGDLWKWVIRSRNDLEQYADVNGLTKIIVKTASFKEAELFDLNMFSYNTLNPITNRWMGGDTLKDRLKLIK